MANEAVWKGSREIQEQPGSPHIVDRDDGQRAVRIYEGPWETIYNNRPARGDLTNGLDGFFVWETDLVKQAGNKGVLTVRLADTAPTGTNLSIGPGDEEVEIDWQVIELPLERHPRYRVSGGGAKELTDEELEQVEEKLRNKDKHTFASGSAVEEFYLKKLRGQSHYRVWYPVIRKRTIISGTLNPSDFNAGTVQDPPIGIGGNWKYQKTADRAIKKSGIRYWERYEEWSGAEEIDPDIYGEG